MSSDPWGRVDETGTVYVRTADGEQVVGSWQAGSPEEALAYFERKYEGLVVEIGLLEKRVKTTGLSSKDAQVAIDHIREQVDAHHAVGDLAALKVRLDHLVETVEARREERKQQRAKQSDEARHAKEALVVEAEELALGTAHQLDERTGTEIAVLGLEASQQAWEAYRDVECQTVGVLLRRRNAGRDGAACL